MTKKIAIYPGTFDPITSGHLDIINRATKLFDELIITIAVNMKKKPLFSIEERKNLILDATTHLKNVRVESFDGLLVNFAKERKATALIRGLRAISDFEYEFQMALMNRKLYENISTVFLMPHEKYTYLNSSVVREVASLGGDVDDFVTPLVAQKLKEKFKLKQE